MFQPAMLLYRSVLTGMILQIGGGCVIFYPQNLGGKMTQRLNFTPKAPKLHKSSSKGFTGSSGHSKQHMSFNGWRKVWWFPIIPHSKNIISIGKHSKYTMEIIGKWLGEVILFKQPWFFSTLKNPWVLNGWKLGKLFPTTFPWVSDSEKIQLKQLGYHPKASRNDACAFSTKRWWHVHQHQQEGIKLAQEFHSCKKKLERIQSYSVWVRWFNLFYYGKSNHWMCLNDRTEIDFLSSHSHGVFCCQGQRE